IVRRLSRTCCVVLFFFQAEDGIRDFHVTGVQTCALPISAETEVNLYATNSSSNNTPFKLPVPSRLVVDSGVRPIVAIEPLEQFNISAVSAVTASVAVPASVAASSTSTGGAFTVHIDSTSILTPKLLEVGLAAFALDIAAKPPI